MNFYIVSNGYVGSGYCRVYVSANTEKRAKALASVSFKKHIDKYNLPGVATKESFYDISKLAIEYVLDGTAENASEVDE